MSTDIHPPLTNTQYTLQLSDSPIGNITISRFFVNTGSAKVNLAGSNKAHAPKYFHKRSGVRDEKLTLNTGKSNKLTQ